MTKVITYTNPTCPWCIKTKAFLKEHNIKFEDRSVRDNKKFADEMIKKSGQMSVPVICIDEDIVIGYNPEKLKKKLDIK